MAKSKKVTKKRVVIVEPYGEAHINATFNNIILTLTNKTGQAISWSSAGKMGFKGSKKNTPYAASQAAADCGKVAYDLGLRKVEVFVKGPGAGRESAIRTLQRFISCGLFDTLKTKNKWLDIQDQNPKLRAVFANRSSVRIKR